MFAVLAATRFAHFAAMGLLFGLAAFPFYAGRALAGRAVPRRMVLACAVLALATGVLELLAMVGSMGGTWLSAFDPDMLAAAVTDTAFGRIWLWRLGLAAVTVALCARRFPRREEALPIASGLLLASVALTGHSAMPGGGVGALHEAADAVHLLAAGWWSGGLLALLMAAGAAGDRLPWLLGRFSRIGYAAVGLIIVSGLIKSVVLVSPASALLTTAYGGVLIAKVALLAAMGLLALSNRVHVTPALKAGVDPSRWRARLVGQVGVEFGLAMLILALVGVLGAMSPPVAE